MNRDGVTGLTPEVESILDGIADEVAAVLATSDKGRSLMLFDDASRFVIVTAKPAWPVCIHGSGWECVDANRSDDEVSFSFRRKQT